MTFDADIQHWPTIAAFVDYLAGVPRPSWCSGLTNHNTFHPDETQWHGMSSMQSMMAFYRDTRHWTSGPHLFLAAEAPAEKDKGIFQMTPISHPGTHAGHCNADHLGIENVGNFNAHPPTPDQYSLLLAINRAILEHWGIPPASVNVHNECMPGRTCPGKYLTGTQIRADLNKPWRPAPTVWPATVIGLPIYQRSDRTGPLAGYLYTGDLVAIDDLSNGHLLDQRGFVDIKGLDAR